MITCLYASPTKTGTHSLTPSSAARATSFANPRSTSSLPDPHWRKTSWIVNLAALKAASANCDSGDRLPDRWLIIAPAPTRSSKAGRRLPSSRQRSPAGITAIFRPYFPAAAATAAAFLRQPASTGVGLADRVRVEPLGEGKTIRVPGRMVIRDAGDKEKPVCVLREPAQIAPIEAA